MGTRNRFNVCFPCCVDNSPCDKCNDQDTTRTVTFDGFTFGCCNYGAEPPFNASFSLSQPSPLSRPCRYVRYTPRYLCYQYYPTSLGGTIFLDATVLDSGNYGWRCQLYVGSTIGSIIGPYGYCSAFGLVFEWDSGAASKFDCTAARSLTLTDITYTGPYSTAYGNLSGVTCELT